MHLSLRGIMLYHFSCLFQVGHELGEVTGRRSSSRDSVGALEYQEDVRSWCALLAQLQGDEAVLAVTCRKVALQPCGCLSPGAHHAIGKDGHLWTWAGVSLSPELRGKDSV